MVYLMSDKNRTFAFIKTRNINWYCETNNVQLTEKKISNVKKKGIVFFIHGTGGSSISWESILDELGTQFPIFTVDLPNHGKSKSSASFKLTLRNISLDIIELLSMLEINYIKAFVGHSAGVTLALELLLQNTTIRVDKLFGINPSLVPPPKYFAFLLNPMLAPLVTSKPSLRFLSEYVKNSTVIDRLLDSTGSFLIDQNKREDYKRLFDNTKHINGALNFMAVTDIRSVLERSGKITTELFFLVGKSDLWVNAKKLEIILKRYFPRATSKEIEGGHLLNETHAIEISHFLLKEIN